MSKKKSQRLDSAKVFKFIGRRVRTTEDIATHFKVGKQQAAAAVAILRIKESVEPAEPAKTKDGVSRWQAA